ncbi:hypothetical protein ACL03H_10485 [Saccharopolyspora sp. MS10]|uniref:hypothetical protein n=1 Tax=Saccharopolyspora sp. MS10 TaxID=3385973 RepID=UPI0039A1935B
MSRLVASTAALLAPLVLAGCATGTAREVSQRETVPVAEFDVASGAIFDDAFEPARLRAIDPCAALRSAGLESYGEPASDIPGEPGSCSNFMKDHAGEQFNVTLYLDNEVYETPHRIGGLPAEVLPEDDTCFVRAAYQGSGTDALGTKFGMQVQLLSEGVADPCSPAVRILTSVAEIIRTDPPIGSTPGSIASYDPCSMLTPVEARDALAGVTSPAEARGLFRCGWSGDNGMSAAVRFDAGRVETGPVPPADLGGGTFGSVLPGSIPGGCRVQWVHRGDTTPARDDELAEVSIINSGRLPLDPCAHAIGAARAARAKLPRG